MASAFAEAWVALIKREFGPDCYTDDIAVVHNQDAEHQVEVGIALLSRGGTRVFLAKRAPGGGVEWAKRQAFHVEGD